MAARAPVWSRSQRDPADRGEARPRPPKPGDAARFRPRRLTPRDDRSAMTGAVVRRAAPAKLNLYLHVVGRRADGYHLLDSLVAFAEVGDEIIAEAAPSFSLKITGPYAAALGGTPRDNLVWRAAEGLAAHAKREAAAALTLVKNLPVASGIGGGSSDAAATLRALASLWEISVAEDELAALGMRLGA